MKTDKIYLVGFMGAGKTTVAAALAARLGWEMEDIDQGVAAQEGHSIADIFAREGEAYFREVEHAILLSGLARRRVVVATGGGTFVASRNRTLINDDGMSIWLDASFDSVSQRIPRDGQRPLAVDPTVMRHLWNERRPAYSHAHLRLPADDTPVRVLVDQILEAAELP